MGLRSNPLLALVVAVAVLMTGCATGAPSPQDRLGGAPVAVAPPNPSRNTAMRADPADRARFDCAVTVQQAQNFDPGRSIGHGSLIGMFAGGAVGGALGALFGLIGDIPGKGAAAGAIALGGAGLMAGGLIKLAQDTNAYERGVAACLTARAAAAASPVAGEPGLVEYRLRVLSVRHHAFTAFLSAGELGEGATGPGLVRLAETADTGTLERGAVLVDRHIAAVEEPVARAFGAAPAVGRVKLGGARQDYWDEARWYGKPGERTIWVVTARARNPQEVRRIALSDTTALAQFRPTSQPIFATGPDASVSVALPYLQRAQDRGSAGAWIDRALDRSRGIAAVVAVSDEVFPDRVYFVVNHAATAATYEAVLAWSQRGGEREQPREP